MTPAVALRRLLAPAPGRLEFAARLALVCALTTLVTAICQTPSPALTAYVAFFLNKPDRAGTVVLSLAMTIVITVVLGLLVIIADAVVDVAAWRIAGMAVLSAGLLFLASASKLRPIGGTVALIVAYALDLLGSVPSGELATRGLLYAWLFVGIPAGITVVVSLLLAPPPRRLVQRTLASRLRTAAAVLQDPGGAATRDPGGVPRQEDEQVHEWLRMAWLERTSPPQDIAALGHAVSASSALLSAVDFMARTAGARLPDPLCACLSRRLEDLALVFERGGATVETEPLAIDRPALSPLAASSLAAIEAAIERFGEPSSPGPAPKEASGFFVPDAFTNPDHVRYALKTTAAAMLCYLVYSLLDWPGIHTCMITCYIVSQSTVADSVEKLGLRVAGCAAGAALGVAAIVFVVPSFTSVAALMAMVFAGGLAGAWIAAGSPRVSYAGFQLAFAFFLCVVQGAAPAFDLVVARDRVIGIVLGNVVLHLVSAHVWPVSVRGRIEAGIAKALHQLGLMMVTRDDATRRHLSEQAHAALGAVQADLEVAHYEPASVRPAAPWLRARREMAERLASLETPLWMCAEQDAAASAAIARRLDRVAGTQAPAAGGAAESAARAVSLPGIVDARLRGLEHAVRSTTQPAEPAHAPA